MILQTERQFKHYKENEDRIILKDGLLLRKYYGETGSFSYYQNLLPQQLVTEVFLRLHGNLGMTPELPKHYLLTVKSFSTQTWRN